MDQQRPQHLPIPPMPRADPATMPTSAYCSKPVYMDSMTIHFTKNVILRGQQVWKSGRFVLFCTTFHIFAERVILSVMVV